MTSERLLGKRTLMELDGELSALHSLPLHVEAVEEASTRVSTARFIILSEREAEASPEVDSDLQEVPRIASDVDVWITDREVTCVVELSEFTRDVIEGELIRGG